jgi:hypothetical protein
VGPIGGALAQDDEPDPVPREILDLDARNFGRGPGGIIMATQGADRCAQRSRHDVVQAPSF